MKSMLKHANLALMAILVITLSSCSEDSENKQTTAVAVEKTNVPFNLADGTPAGSTTGKNIKRGTIDVKIKSIDLTATKIWTNGAPQLFNYSVSDVFNILNPSETGYSTADANISLADVAIGTNNFHASTTASGAQVSAVNTTTNVWVDELSTIAIAETKLAANKAHIPYVLYSGDKVQEIYKPDVAANNVVIPMNTTNGRILATFNLTDLLVKLEYTAKVTISTYKANNSLIQTFPVQTLTNGNVISFEWSDANSTAGAYATYKVDIYEKNNNTILYSYTYKDANTTIASAVSRSCRYVVAKESILVNLEGVDGFKFITPWSEVDCPTCPNVVP